MSDAEFALMRYLKAQAERREAQLRYNWASSALELAQIEERFAEIRSQVEPLAGLLEREMSERDRLLAIAQYVVIGRFPEGQGGE